MSHEISCALIQQISELISLNVKLTSCQRAVTTYHHCFFEEQLWQQHTLLQAFQLAHN